MNSVAVLYFFMCTVFSNQMLRLLNFKNKDEAVLDEEGEVEECPMSDHLQEVLLNYHEMMVKKVGCKSVEEMVAEIQRDDATWLDKLASMLVPMPPAPLTLADTIARNGPSKLKLLFMDFCAAPSIF